MYDGDLDKGGTDRISETVTDYDWAQDLALYYYSHGDLHQALWGKYELDANGDPVAGTYETLGMREFRYNGPRARYLAMDYDTYGSDDPARAGWTDATSRAGSVAS